jgi:CubicO group peptidase (beta-lactamase class C family)
MQGTAVLYKRFYTLLFIFSVLTVTGCSRLEDLPVGLGYASKYICSAIFTSGFDETQVIEHYVAPAVYPLPLVWEIDVDFASQQVRVWDSINGQDNDAHAFYTPGKGCTLLVDRPLEEVQSIPFTATPAPLPDPELPWPYGSSGEVTTSVPGLDYQQLNLAVEQAFVENPDNSANTLSVLVAYDGQLVAEAYANSATAESKLVGWSMTKTITGMLAGILSDQGRLDLDAPAPIAEWQNTEKAAITTRNLLNMSSGLLVDEDYQGLSGVTQMLYLESNQFAFALDQPKVYEAGEVFQYSTVEAARLAAVVQGQLGGSQQAMYDFYQSQLFHKLGISSALIEFDAYGNMVGGAYAYMKTRDWARLGQLYLQHGNWNGVQVISSEFVDFATRPSLSAPDYGAQIWLNTDGIAWPSIPHDAFYFLGHQGQYVVGIPSKKLLVVRTGVTEDPLLHDHLIESLLNEVIASLPD